MVPDDSCQIRAAPPFRPWAMALYALVETTQQDIPARAAELCRTAAGFQTDHA